MQRTIRRFSNAFTSLNPKITESLSKANITKPTHIQEAAIPMLIARKSAIIAAETGSGKTLAYLLPILHLLSLNNKSHEKAIDSNNYSPKCLIITPARHLQIQIINVLRKTLSHSSFSLLPPPEGIPLKVLGNHEIAICSPQTFLEHYKKPSKMSQILARTEHIVFDEADMSIDKGLGFDLLSRMVMRLKHMKSFNNTQFIFAAATLAHPRTANEKCPRALIIKSMKKKGIVTIDSKSLHSTPPNLVEEFKMLDNENDRFLLLTRILQDIANKEQTDINSRKRILIFCNTVFAADFCFNQLSKLIESEKLDFELRCSLVHGNEDKDERTSTVLKFASGKEMQWKSFTKSPQSNAQTKKLDVLVCTDLLSRGVDFQNIFAVIHYDFPKCAANYIHRVGRTCRGEAQTGISVAIFTEDDKHLCDAIMVSGSASLPSMKIRF